MPEPVDDLFLDNDQDTDDGDETPVAGSEDSSTIKEIRSALRRSERARKAESAELQELRSFREEYQEKQRASTVADLFKEASLNPAHAKLFLALNPDGEPTLDAVKAFASENALVTTDGQTVDAPADGFVPPDTGNPPVQGKVTQQELMKIYRENPQRARQLWEKGMVETVDVPWSTQPHDWAGTG
jgi:hypothetical protein